MISIANRKQYQDAVIAQADSGGYDPSGFVAVVKDQRAALAAFGHCSCYGTWEALNGGGVSDSFDEVDPAKTGWDWEGTPDELVTLAARIGDPSLPNQPANPKDYNYGYLTEVYAKIIEWDRTRVRPAATSDPLGRIIL